MTSAEIAELRERQGNALLKLDLREQDVQRLEARNAYLPRSRAETGRAPIIRTR
jgi:hypothetical protein